LILSLRPDGISLSKLELALEKSIYNHSLINGCDTMEVFEVLVPIIMVLAAVLLALSMMAYKRERSWRLLFAGVIFGLFLIKSIVMSISIFTPSLEDVSDSINFHLLFDVILLLFLFFAVLKTPKKEEKAESDPKDAKKKKT